ncbi:SagB-type dehydrogenase domain-containing protein [Thermanaeromonas toyohensis ToBE]|uniref:SagB-type dehydrogenase domain-containing protein n=1 Tax=Thermanaeromonas toyohensis ToBE TaxID=698762 RepID=A0A1W1W3A6_9FIRM|nr:nitroreductase family protein [Thermanaeromonas toyohensis]SMB99861.1 SagB-type dehydrogenase domain-containing protein [Thermanaeromonas toyohensis ToBE]
MSKDVLSAIKERRSIRRFKPDPVPEDILNTLLEAACAAPSAGNVQPWLFYRVHRAEIKEALAQAALGQKFVAQAPVVIVVCADLDRAAAAYGERGRTLYCLQDTAAAITNLMLAATNFGLGTCWVGAFDEAAASRILQLPPHVRPVAMIPLGYPAHSPSPTSRRRLNEVVKVLN